MGRQNSRYYHCGPAPAIGMAFVLFLTDTVPGTAVSNMTVASNEIKIMIRI